MKISMTGQEIGDCFIGLTVWKGLTVFLWEVNDVCVVLEQLNVKNANSL